MSREQLDFMDEVFNNIESAKGKKRPAAKKKPRRMKSRGSGKSRKEENKRPKRMSKTAPNANYSANKLGSDLNRITPPKDRVNTMAVRRLKGVIQRPFESSDEFNHDYDYDIPIDMNKKKKRKLRPLSSKNKNTGGPRAVKTFKKKNEASKTGGVQKRGGAKKPPVVKSKGKKGGRNNAQEKKRAVDSVKAPRDKKQRISSAKRNTTSCNGKG